MTKRIVLTLLQFLLFCALFYVGGLWAEIRLGLEIKAMQQHTAAPPLIPEWLIHLKPTLDYALNGLVYASVLLVLILLFEVVRKRLRPWAGLTLLAFLLALAASLLAHSGFYPVTPGS